MEHVLISSIATFWISQNEATSIARQINDGVQMIAVHGKLISTFQVKGIVSGKEYRREAKLQKRNWLCEQNGVHAYNGGCDCLDSKKAIRSPDNTLNLTKTERVRRRAIIEYVKKYMGQPDMLKNHEAREKYVKRCVAKIVG